MILFQIYCLNFLIIVGHFAGLVFFYIFAGNQSKIEHGMIMRDLRGKITPFVVKLFEIFSSRLPYPKPQKMIEHFFLLFVINEIKILILFKHFQNSCV